MAHDRFIRFSAPAPTRESVQTVLEDFFRGIGKVRWSGVDTVASPRFYVSLPGKVCWALTRVYPDCHRAKAQAEEVRPRWIEVVLVYEPDHLQADVITREMDDVTNAMAEGLAELLATACGGTRERTR